MAIVRTASLGDEPSVLKVVPLTAKEMLSRPHTLSPSKEFATLADGSVWIWDTRFKHWAIWKK